MSMSGRVVVVTGAGGAVGSTVVRRLLDSGAKVAGFDRHGVAPPDGCTRAFAVELTDDTQVARAFAEIESSLGPVWGLVNVAGTWAGGTPTDTTGVDVFESMVAINLRSCFLATRAAMARMRVNGGGRIVSVSSLPAVRGTGGANASAYVLSKAGVTALMQVVAEEGKSLGVRANVVAPGTIRTTANERAMPAADFGAWATLDEVAAALVFAVSDECGVTGSVFEVPGRA